MSSHSRRSSRVPSKDEEAAVSPIKTARQKASDRRRERKRQRASRRAGRPGLPDINIAFEPEAPQRRPETAATAAASRKTVSPTNPEKIVINGQEQSNPFFEPLPKEVQVYFHDPGALRIIDGPLAAEKDNLRIAEIMYTAQPEYSSTKLLVRPKPWTLPEATDEELSAFVDVLEEYLGISIAAA